MILQTPPGEPAWTPVLADLARQLDTGRIYDRDVAAAVATINVVCKSAERW